MVEFGSKRYYENLCKETEDFKKECINDLITYIKNGGKSHFLIELAVETIYTTKKNLEAFKEELSKTEGKK